MCVCEFAIVCAYVPDYMYICVCMHVGMCVHACVYVCLKSMSMCVCEVCVKSGCVYTYMCMYV